jgi:hypothetical protein
MRLCRSPKDPGGRHKRMIVQGESQIVDTFRSVDLRFARNMGIWVFASNRRARVLAVLSGMTGLQRFRAIWGPISVVRLL